MLTRESIYFDHVIELNAQIQTVTLLESTAKITWRNHIPTCDDQSQFYSARTQRKEK